MNRRDFIKQSSLLTLAHCIPSLAFAMPEPTNNPSQRTLILVELKGGNDGLNTLIPYTNELYYQKRPSIAIPKKAVLTLNQELGLHPALQALMPYWEHGQMGWLQGLGYENPNRSHFKSIDIWETGSRHEKEQQEGWVSKMIKNKPLKGISIGHRLGPLYTDQLSSVGVIDPLKFARLGKTINRSEQSSTNHALQHLLNVQTSVHDLSRRFIEPLKNVPTPPIPFPNHPFGKTMESVYKLMLSNLAIPVYKVSLNGFDTHAAQVARHEKQLKILANTLSIFAKNINHHGRWNQTMLMSYSEFGRRLKENANQGTDHGAAAPHFLLGGKIKGGFYGQAPALDTLDKRGDLIYTTDFRDVYRSIAQHWWMYSDQTSSLNFIQS